ncbi:MAG: DUF882 domain-containing protein [Steroidobacteraceae bacterium]
MSSGNSWSRRRMLLNAAAGALLLPLAGVARAAGTPSAPRGVAERWLELVNTHTGETAAVAYRAATGLVTESLGALARLLRDHRNGEQHPIDPLLYDQLADLADAAKAAPRFEVISGYRSPATNARLAANSSGVATRSLHLEGRAIDVRLKRVSSADLRDLALAAGRGGVGYYRRSDFVHLDTGRVRSWAG